MQCCSHPFTGPGYTLVLISLALLVKETDKFITSSVTVKSSVGAHICAPSTQEAEAEGWLQAESWPGIESFRPAKAE